MLQIDFGTIFVKIEAANRFWDILVKIKATNRFCDNKLHG